MILRTFQKLIHEARNFDIRKIGNQQGPAGAPTQSSIRNLGFIKPEDQTSRKLYDPRNVDSTGVLGSIVSPAPVKETEKIVYTGIALALSIEESRKKIEKVVEEYMIQFRTTEAALREQARIGDRLQSVRDSIDRMLQKEKKDFSEKYFDKLQDDLELLKERYDQLDTIISDGLKYLQETEPCELKGDNDEYIPVEFGKVYSTVYDEVQKAVKTARDLVISQIPAEARADKENVDRYLSNAFKSVYKEYSDSVLITVAAFFKKDKEGVRGGRSISAFSKFKENVLIKREEAKVGLSRRYILFDPVSALAYVIKNVTSKAIDIATYLENPVVDYKGENMFRATENINVEPLIRIVKADRGRRDKIRLYKVLEALEGIPNSNDAKIIIGRYMRGDAGVNEAMVIRALRSIRAE